MLPPLVNLFAFSSPDSRRSNQVGRQLRASNRFQQVWEPADGWVAAAAPLPHSSMAEAVFANGVVLERTSADERRGEVRFTGGGGASAIRSGAGLVPVYVWREGPETAISTLLSDVVRFVPRRLELDRLVCAMWLAHQPSFPDGRTFFRGVHLLPSGSESDISATAVRSSVTWSPWPDEEVPWPSRNTRRDHVAQFRSALLDALRVSLPEDDRSLVTLSGGVDSSLIAAVGGGHLGRPLAALSLVPEAGHVMEEREWGFLRRVVDTYGIAPHIVVPLSSAARLDLVSRTPQVAFPVIHPALQVLEAVHAESGASVMVGGEYADEVCGGWVAETDWLESMSPVGLARSVNRLPRGRQSVRRWAGWVRRGRSTGNGPWRRELPDLFTADLREEYETWRSDQLRRLAASQGTHRHVRALVESLDGVPAMNWEVCSALGMRRAFPFLTEKVVEVVAACHPAELLGPGVKRLERQAFADLVPADLLHRADDGSFGPTRGEGQEFPVHDLPELLAGMVERQPTGLPNPLATGWAVMVRFADAIAGLGRRPFS